MSTIVVLAAVGGLFLWQQGRDFRAIDDSTEEAGLGYVEHVTMERFYQAIEAIPFSEVSDQEALSLLTELAGNGYFRLLTVAARQEFLFAWTAEQRLKDLVERIEMGPEGAWTWLEWVEPYCEDGGDDKSGFFGTKTAHAQISNLCLELALSEKKPKDQPKKWVRITSIEQYAITWGVFIQKAFDKCHSNPSYSEHGAEIIYFKSCWSAQQLDTLYDQFWPDIKQRRSSNLFNKLERERIRSASKVYIEWRGRENAEINAPINRAVLEAALIVSPIGPETIAMKIGAGAITKLAATRVARPLALGFVIQKTRIGTQIATLVTPLFRREVRIDLTAMFSRARIFSNSNTARILGGMNGKAWVELALHEATEGAADILTGTTIRGSAREVMESRIYAAISDLDVVSAKDMGQMITILSGSFRFADTKTFGLAVPDIRSGVNTTALNEDAIYVFARRNHLTQAEIQNIVRHTWIHEFNHHLMQNSFTKFSGSKKLGQKVLEEGFGEYMARKFVPTSKIVAYTAEQKIAVRYREMLVRKYVKENRFDPVRAGIEADKKIESLLYEVVEREPGAQGGLVYTQFETTILGGLAKDHEIRLGGQNSVIKWIVGQAEANDFDRIYRLIDSAY